MRCLFELPIFVLIIFHFCFWWKFYTNPWRLCTSEVVSNEFPYWWWFGQELRKGRFAMTDNIYYRQGGSIPFLSTFYPPNLISSLISSFLTKERAFVLYVYHILLHNLFGSLGAFWVLSQWVNPSIALFGALSLTYNAYMIRPQTVCEMYTMAWIPLCLVKGWFGMVAFGMAVLGGYWPIILAGFPIFFYNPLCLIGGILALPQIIPFLSYYPRSVRAKKPFDKTWGRMPFKRFFFQLRWPENGMIHYPEYSFGIGICAILALFYPSWWWILAIYGFIGSQGLFILDRIPARFVYLVSFSLIMASIFSITDTKYIIPMIILQGFLLWKNRDIYPSFPFSQWWRKLSDHKFIGKEWPNNTGYLTGEHHHDYYGGFSLAENYRE